MYGDEDDDEDDVEDEDGDDGDKIKRRENTLLTLKSFHWQLWPVEI